MRFRIPFMFRTISLRTAIIYHVFCIHWSFSSFSVILKTPIDSVLHLSANMTSADFCMFNNASRHCLLLSRLPMQTSSGTHTFFHSIYLPHLPCMIPCSYWASSCTADLPSYIASYVISVRQTRALPMG